jgi:hypothetical protein
MLRLDSGRDLAAAATAYLYGDCTSKYLFTAGIYLKKNKTATKTK